MSGAKTAAAPSGVQRLIEGLDAGQPAAIARAVSVVENRRPESEALLAAIHGRLGHARRIGITGPPGAGKSTLTTALAAAYREAGLRVGIIAVDPTSPFTGGALLGDRIRMERVALDPGVFIRSLATRGSLGGLSAATRDVADVLDGFGMHRVLVETVGVGQSELDVARVADSTVVVLVPESGDSIQTLKAGLMEIADIFVVNKADRPGADRLRHDIEVMLGLREGAPPDVAAAHHGADPSLLNPARAARRSAARSEAERWMPPVIRAVATDGEGVRELIAALDAHADYLARSGALRHRRRTRLRERVVEIAEHRLRHRLWNDHATHASLEAQLDALLDGRTTPFAVADALLDERVHFVTRRPP